MLFAILILVVFIIALMRAMEEGKLPPPPAKTPPRIADTRVRELAKLTDPAAQNWKLSPDLKTVTTKSGLKYQDLKLGSGESPTRGGSVLVDYVGWREDGFKFDSSFDPGRLPFSFRLGAGKVIRGWEEGVATMKVGGVRRLVIPPDLGYGRSGNPPAIESNVKLIFIVRLLGVKHRRPSGQAGSSAQPSNR
jgi:peptidylprolyl isomerase